MLYTVKTSSIYHILAIYPILVLAIKDDINTHAIMIKAQKKKNRSSSLHSFEKTITKGYDKYN